MVINDLKKEISSLIGNRDAQLLITSLLNMSVTDYTLSRNASVDSDKASLIKSSAKRIKNGEPLQYVVGTTEFMSLKFNVSPAVLIPRPDTETLVEHAISEIGSKSVSVLDIGTGSGCVAISIASYCKNTTVTSVDISNKALKIAKHNARMNNTKVKFIHSDILNDIPKNKYNIVVSNPPYIPTDNIKTLDSNVKDYEPTKALDGGLDGLDFYRRIVHISHNILTDGGTLMFEVGHDQSEIVKKLMINKFDNIKIIKDLTGINRVVSGSLKTSI